MENINVQVYSLVSEPISAVEKLRTIAKLGFSGAEFTADFTQVPLDEMKKVLEETGLKVNSAHVASTRSSPCCRISQSSAQSSSSAR